MLDMQEKINMNLSARLLKAEFAIAQLTIDQEKACTVMEKMTKIIEELHGRLNNGE